MTNIGWTPEIDFLSIQENLHQELEKIEKGSAEFIDLQELDNELESTIHKYEVNSNISRP